MDYINEELTRKKWIDEKLKSSGWTSIIDYKDDLDVSSLHKTVVTEYPTESGPADYILFLRGKPYAVVEAKKRGLGPQNVLVQAQRYAKTIKVGLGDFNGCKIPFAYSTNGEIIWFQDYRPDNSRSRTIKEFHTPTALEEAYTAGLNQNLSWFTENPIENSSLRYYQKEAISSIESAIQNNKRSMLVAMATGTGKTFTTANLIYRLLKSGASKRILFLVDRKALAAQAVMEFAAYEAENGLKFNQIYQVYSQKFQKSFLEGNDNVDFNALPTSYLTDPDGNQVFVYICTIQRMQINLFGKEGMPWVNSEYDPDEDADKLDIPIHAFDTIIADECHRGYTSQEVSKWREVLDHFDAIKVGLTATPAAHTITYFKEIVYRYTFEKAVEDGYLVDYDAVNIESGVRLKGVTIPEGEEVYAIDTSSGAQQLDLLEDERKFEVTDIERDITVPDSNKKVIQEFALYAQAFEMQYGRFPKTLIFADNDLPHTSHADQIVNICRDFFNKGDAFVQKITGSPTVDKPLQRIKEFRNRPEPHIVVTVDMLSTGVDIPSLECILFLRPVKSRILFEQMLGRGTRLCTNFPNGAGTPPKDHFTVFDCFGGTLLEAFRNSTGMTQSKPSTPTRSLKDIIQEINDNVEVEYNTRCLVKRFQRIAKSISSDGRIELSKFIPDGDIAEFAKGLANNLAANRIETLKTLTNPDFIKFLENYPRIKKKFIVAVGASDHVSSKYIFRTTDGRDLKPEDYIKQFEKFVKENPEHIEAIKIILEKPASWNADALRDLRTKLKMQPEKFTEVNLRRAYKYPLADIISIIKHAGKDEPLLSSKERVELAITKVTEGKQLTQEQQEWMELIKKHLIENLTIESDDFDTMPIFVNRGGNYNRINRIFNNDLQNYIKQLNSALPQVYYAA